MSAYGYIRKSVVHDPTRTISPEMQDEAIRRLATTDGHDGVTILSDLDVSGRKGRAHRPGWDTLLRSVEDGEATAVYAYSLSRFARSVAQLAGFFDLCERKRVRVRVDRDHIDTSTATGRLVTNVLASLSQFEADVASERVRDAFAVKRQRDPSWLGPGNRPYGDRVGEDPSTVVDAFKEAGSYDGAARLLNGREVPTRGPGMWHGTTVRDLVRREAPDLVAPGVVRGASAGRGDFRLARLLRCSVCGLVMSPSMDKRRDEVRYYCHGARVTPHGRGWVSESKLIAHVAHEAKRAATFTRRMQKGSAADDAALARLAAKRTRVIDLYAEGVIDKPDRDVRLATIAEAESKLTTRKWVRHLTIAPVVATFTDSSGRVVEASPPGRVNAYLRRLFVSITVDMSQPTKRGPSSWVPSLAFDWTDPTMRAHDPDEE